MRHTHKKLIATALATATSMSISFTHTAKASDPNADTPIIGGGDLMSDFELDYDPTNPSIDPCPTTEDLSAEEIAKTCIGDKLNQIIDGFPGLKTEIRKKGITYELMSYEEFIKNYPDMARNTLTESNPALTCVFIQNKFLIVFDPGKCVEMKNKELTFLAAYALANLFDTIINFHFVPDLQAHINLPITSMPRLSAMLTNMTKQDTVYHQWLTYSCYPSNGLPLPTKIEEIRTDPYIPSTVFPEIDDWAKTERIVNSVRIASPYLSRMSEVYRENRHRFAATFALNYLKEPGRYSDALRILMEYYSAAFLL